MIPARIHLVGARAGQGTSTVALALASITAELGVATALVTDDLDGFGSLTGCAVPDLAVRLPLTRRLSLWRADQDPTDADLIVEDNRGRSEPADPRSTLLVVRGPDYLSLRTAVRQPCRACGVIVVAEPWRALSAADAASVLGLPIVAEVAHQPEVARAADAGLLLDRIAPMSAFRSLRRLATSGIHPAVVDAASA